MKNKASRGRPRWIALSRLLSLLLALYFEGVDEIFGEQVVCFSMIFFDPTSIAEGGEDWIDRKLRQQRSAGHIDQFSAIAGAEYLVAFAFRSLKVGHVLDDANDDALELTYHIDTFHDHHGCQHLG